MDKRDGQTPTKGLNLTNHRQIETDQWLMTGLYTSVIAKIKTVELTNNFQRTRQPWTDKHLSLVDEVTTAGIFKFSKRQSPVPAFFTSHLTQNYTNYFFDVSSEKEH